MLRTIHLHGSLAERFQPTYSLDVETPVEALRAIMSQVPGFELAIREGEFCCVRGDFDRGVECDEQLLTLQLGNVKDFHIVPAAVGAKRGMGKILLGVAMIGAVMFTGGAALAAVGLGAGTLGGAGGLAIGSLVVGMSSTLGLYTAALGGLLILSGTAQALSPMPKMSKDLTSDDKAGYLFNGAVNTSEQGAAVPIVFGRIRAGSVIVSAGITSERTSEAAGGAETSTSTGAVAPDPIVTGVITYVL